MKPIEERATTYGIILLSYGRPVAYYDWHSGKYFRVAQGKESMKRLIDKWLCGNNAKIQPQEFFDRLLEFNTNGK